jgi:hypothetical protein
MAGRRSNYKKIKQQLAQTPGAEKLYTDWQDRAANSLWDLIKTSKTFSEDVKDLRSNEKLTADDKALLLINKYAKHGLRFAATELVRHYIETDQVNPHVMRPPVIAVSTKENIAGPAVAHNNGSSLKKMLDTAMKEHPDNWVYLVVDPDCTKEDMLEWVNNNWDWFLQDRLDATKPYKFKRVKGSSYAERDQIIYEHIKVKKKPAHEIADKYNIDAEYARKIASRMATKLKKQDK